MPIEGLRQGFSFRERPQVEVNGLHRDVVSRTWKALLDMNNPPILFRRESVLVVVSTDEGGDPTIQVLAKVAIRGILERLVDFVHMNEDGHTCVRHAPENVVADMAKFVDTRLPILHGVLAAPFFAPPGVLVTDTGYYQATGTYLRLADRLTVQTVPESPDGATISRARDFLLVDFLGDFPFHSVPDKANALAALVLPFVRPLIEGSTPLHLFESPTAGTGKSLLADVCSIVATGSSPAVMTQPRDEDEWARSLLAKLLEGPPCILLDNLHDEVRSSALASALTAPRFSGRQMGRSQMASAPVICTWSTKRLFHSGSNSALPKRNTIRFCTVSLPR